MDLEQLRTTVSDSLGSVDKLILTRLNSDVPLISELGTYLVNSGGKRLRPLLVLLSAQAFTYTGHQAIHLAAIIEFIHTATLLHDDVVDASLLRRGHKTANAIWGNQASVLVGDFLYSRAFQMLVELDVMPIMALFADVTNAIAEGEVMQLANCNNPNITEADYFTVIECKTARLFACAAQLGATLTAQPKPVIDAMYNYGLLMGQAYQIIDDALDFHGNPDTIGKNIGDDLREGKTTLPLIYTLARCDPPTRLRLQQALTTQDQNRLAELQEAIQSTGAITAVFTKAHALKSQALAELQTISPYGNSQALVDLAEFAVTRQF